MRNYINIAPHLFYCEYNKVPSMVLIMKLTTINYLTSKVPVTFPSFPASVFITAESLNSCVAK